MMSWEYVVLARLADQSAAEEMIELDQYGAAGWELVAVRNSRDLAHYYLKRPKRDSGTGNE